jgi:hypothetical protein
MRTGHFHSPAEAGALSQTGQVGPDAVLAGGVFDPLDVPFLLLPGELPVAYPNFSGSGSACRGSSFDTHDSIEGVVHERGKISQGLGKFSHERS